LWAWIGVTTIIELNWKWELIMRIKRIKLKLLYEIITKIYHFFICFKNIQDEAFKTVYLNNLLVFNNRKKSAKQKVAWFQGERILVMLSFFQEEALKRYESYFHFLKWNCDFFYRICFIDNRWINWWKENNCLLKKLSILHTYFFKTTMCFLSIWFISLFCS